MEIEKNIFFDEFKNKLTSLENSLIDIQNGNYEKENINEIFRAIHTIKGTADLLGMFEVVALTHKAEDLLEFVREGKIRIDHKLATLFMDLKNFILHLVDNIAQGIFDDSEAEKLFIVFENEFNKFIHLAQNTEYINVKTLLVIADSALVRYMIKKIGTDEGYNVLTSDNTEDGWVKIKNYAVDLLFCDFTLPNQTSLDLVEKIRVNYETKDLPIVMLVSKNDENINRLGRKTSAKAWLAKPIEENKLNFILKKILEKTS
jgi:CheY-like chemotaxis protein/HPt (histidine-containing phosphotransfer) domain-containing protein